MKKSKWKLYVGSALLVCFIIFTVFFSIISFNHIEEETEYSDPIEQAIKNLTESEEYKNELFKNQIYGVLFIILFMIMPLIFGIVLIWSYKKDNKPYLSIKVKK